MAAISCGVMRPLLEFVTTLVGFARITWRKQGACAMHHAVPLRHRGSERYHWPDSGNAQRLACRESVVVRPFSRAIAGEDKRSEEHTSELQSLMRYLYGVRSMKKTKSRFI